MPSCKQQVRILIDDAIIIPSMNIDLSENLEALEEDFVFRIKIYVEDPESIIQVRASKRLLVNAFQGAYFFNQANTKPYLISVFGIADNRQPLTPIGRRYAGYDWSLLAISVKLGLNPLEDIPPRIKNLIEKEMKATLTKNETAAGQSIFNRISVSTFPVFQPQHQDLALPTVSQAVQYLSRRSATTSSATTGTSLLMRLTSTSSPLPHKKRELGAASSIKAESSFLVPGKSLKGKEKETFISIDKKENTTSIDKKKIFKRERDIEEDIKNYVRRSTRIKQKKSIKYTK